MSKVSEYFKKNKIALIIIFIVWLAGEILIISPIAYSTANSITSAGKIDMDIWTEDFFKSMSSMTSFGKVFSASVFPWFFRGTIIYSIILIVATALGIHRGKTTGYEKIEHGSSDWCEKGEQYKILSKDTGILLAEDNYLPVNKIGNVNVLVVGGSGSGKSASFSIPNAEQQLGSYVFTDPKGEIYDNTAGYLKSQGYDIKVMNLVNPENSDSYNPLFHIQSEIDVDVIASTIVKGQRKREASDPFWDNMAEMLLKALIYYLIATRPPEEQNLVSCSELVRAASNANGDSNVLADLINKLPQDHPARTNFGSVQSAAPSEKTYSGILSSLQSLLGKFDSQDIADLTSTNTINFEDIARKKTAVYVISSDTHSAYDFLLTIFFSQMIQHLYDFADKNGGKLPIPTFFILDEFANIGQIPDFDKKISTSRSRGISFSVILQNLDQLKTIYEKSYETIIGNCDTHVFLGSNSYATVEYFSKELGEKTIERKSKSTSKGKDSKSTTESKESLARALMTPDELRRMDNNDCIIFEKGLKPIKAKKYWWFQKDKVSKNLNSVRLSHIDYNSAIPRGDWRKFNPYNPYISIDEEGAQKNNLEVGSLDDLFEEDNDDIPIPDNAKSEFNQTQESRNNPIPNMNVGAPVVPKKPEVQNVQSNKESAVMDDDEIDIQKQLEAKFDELFGK